jgi:hypothetical protein
MSQPVTNAQNFFSKSKRHAKVGNGATCHAAGEGEILFGEAKTGLTIRMTTLIVPGFAKNILSMKCLLGMGYGVEARGTAMVIMNHKGKTLFT